MALFQHEDFIFLGMMWAGYFKGYLFNSYDGAWGGDSWNGGGGGWLPGGNIPSYGTGRGGILTGLLEVDGDDGRPGAADNSTGPVDPSLAGGKGTISTPGIGLNNGGFGYGGRATLISNGFNTSAGGGSGWFGGGSSILDAGGGGGSNFCYADNNLSDAGASAVVDYSPPDWLVKGKWVGIDLDTLVYYSENSELFTTNTKHIQEYAGLRTQLERAYEAFINLHKLANGNGLCLISKPNELITINRGAGTIDNIAQIVEYSKEVFSWKPLEDGNYQFILWGAQGGTTSYTLPNSPGATFQQYTGGFGGAVSGIFHLSPYHEEIEPKTGTKILVETKIGIYVGEAGGQLRLYNTYNGGGNAGGGGSTSGGGATDLRWTTESGWQGNLFNRFLVAGGGGGCIGANYGNPPIEPITPPGGNNVIGAEQKPGHIKIPNDEPILFLVNDRSLVYVTIQYYTPSILPTNTSLGCTLYINNGSEGVLYQKFTVNPVSGTVEIVYELDQVYPPNTPTHWVGLSVDVSTNIMFIIPNNGVNIRVETRAGVNEPDSNWKDTKPPLFKSHTPELNIVSAFKAMLSSPPGDLLAKIKNDLPLISKLTAKILNVEYKDSSIDTELNIVSAFKAMLSSPPGDLFVRFNSIIQADSELRTSLKDIEYKVAKFSTDEELVSRIKADIQDIYYKQAKLNSSIQSDNSIDTNIKEE